MKFALHTVKNRIATIALSILIVAGFADCNSSKQVAYFQDVPDTASVVKRVKNTAFEEPVIHKGDVLNINITTIDAQVNGIEQQEQAEGKEGESIKGFMVDKDGFIEMPIIGRVQVEGMTTMQLKEAVRQRALKYYKDPLVNVRIVNFYITILGEVRTPGRYIVNTEKVNIMDALGLAGDLTLGGKRNNVMIMREENGETVFTRVDLNSTDIFQSEYFYLQSGDKIYVEPLKALARSGTSDNRADRWVSLTLGVVSVMVATVSLALRL